MTALSKPDGGVKGGRRVSTIGGEHDAKAVGGSSDGSLSSPVCVVDTSWMRMHRTRSAGPHGIGPQSHRQTHRRSELFDLISRGPMMMGLTRVDGGCAVLPFVRMFLWSTFKIPLGGFVWHCPQDAA